MICVCATFNVCRAFHWFCDLNGRNLVQQNLVRFIHSYPSINSHDLLIQWSFGKFFVQRNLVRFIDSHDSLLGWSFGEILFSEILYASLIYTLGWYICFIDSLGWCNDLFRPDLAQRHCVRFINLYAPLIWLSCVVKFHTLHGFDTTMSCTARLVHCCQVAEASSPLSRDVLRGPHDRVEFAFVPCSTRMLDLFPLQVLWDLHVFDFASRVPSHAIPTKNSFLWQTKTSHFCDRLRHLCTVSCIFFTFMSAWCQSKSH